MQQLHAVCRYDLLSHHMSDKLMFGVDSVVGVEGYRFDGLIIAIVACELRQWL